MRLAKFLEGLDNPMKVMGNFDSPKYSWWWGTLVPGRNSVVHHPATAVSSGAANARDCSPTEDSRRSPNLMRLRVQDRAARQKYSSLGKEAHSR